MGTARKLVKPSDFAALGTALGVIGFFALVPGALAAFEHCSKAYPYVMSFVKFAVLATFGECLALRVTTGNYNRKGFGVLPKMVVWGVLGIVIKVAFGIFVTGTPSVLASFGVSLGESGGLGVKVLTAFSISFCMNLIFGPVMMTLHKITDMHISENNGHLSALIRPIDFARHFRAIDWTVMYHFVYKKTIPLFWIPAHTLTFSLPGEYQILFAALLGIALGLILAFANAKK